MPKLVVAGAKMSCTMGSSQSTLSVLPVPPAITADADAATIMDFAPGANIAPFGMCKSPSNPQVQAIILSSSGATTQFACVPVTTAPWTPGATLVTVRNMKALHDGCTLMCTWAGTIKIDDPGQDLVDVK